MRIGLMNEWVARRRSGKAKDATDLGIRWATDLQQVPFFACDFGAMAHVMSSHSSSPFLSETRISLWSTKAAVLAKLADRGLQANLDTDRRSDAPWEDKGPWLITYIAGSIAVRTPEGILKALEKVDETDESTRLSCWRAWFGIAPQRSV